MNAGNRHENAAEPRDKGNAHGTPKRGAKATGARPSTPSEGTSAEGIDSIDAERAQRLADVPPKYRDLYRKAYAGKSRKAAIRAHCLECVYWSADEVRRCTALACPLYEFRLRG